ncbi:CoF synthetase [Cohnella sp.]|uniref:CoF synthetase n=1 Tax=Cohnella sp. TaxID=1883426 RepID=UPI003561F583
MLDTAQLQSKLQSTLDIFPWYGRLLAEFNDHTRAPDSYGKLPLITSDVLEKFYYCPEQPLSQQPGVTSYRTSGTSSLRRKTIYYSPEDEERYVSIKSAIFQQLLQPSTIRTALSDMGTGHAANTALEVFRSIGLKVDSIPFQQPIEQHLERIQAFRPHVLYTMPSILDRLLTESANNMAESGIHKVILVGEIASPSWVHSVAERLGIAQTDITDTYGSIEIGTIAYFSHVHGRYLFAKGIEAEGVAVDALFNDADPLSENESVLVLTSMTRDLFPSLRYVTYDVVRDLRPILVNGQWRQSFKAIVRRLGSELKHGEKISIYDIEDVVYRHLKEAQVRIQVHANKLTVHIDSKEQDPAIFSRIELELLDRIPEIGCMIRGRMLESLRVIPSPLTFDSTVLKHKRIFYD